MKRWLKYGIVFAIIGVVLMVLGVLTSSPFEADLMVMTFLSSPLSWFYLSITGVSFPSELIILGIIGVINWFVIGSLIGFIVNWIVGKVKKK